MARNETFRAKQVEKMSALMASLKTQDENLGEMVSFFTCCVKTGPINFLILKMYCLQVKYGLDSLSRHTHLSPDEDKIDRSFKDRISIFYFLRFLTC